MPFYEIMWKNIVQPDVPQIDNMTHAPCLLDTLGYTHTHSEYVILNVFPHGNKGLSERDSVLLCTLTARLVNTVTLRYRSTKPIFMDVSIAYENEFFFSLFPLLSYSRISRNISRDRITLVNAPASMSPSSLQ